jgi:hypothetical protein
MYSWDAAYYYCEALSKIEGSGITGMAKKDSFERVDGISGTAWLNSLYPSGTTPTSSNECGAFYVNLTTGAASGIHHRRGNANAYALCE